MRVLEVAGLTATNPLIGGVEGEGYEAMGGEELGVETRCLLFDAAEGVGNYYGGVRFGPRDVRREEEVPCNGDAVAFKGDGFWCHFVSVCYIVGFK